MHGRSLRFLDVSALAALCYVGARHSDAAAVKMCSLNPTVASLCVR